MTLSQLFVITSLVVTTITFTVWLISLWRRDVSIVDLVWGLGFVAIAWMSYLLGPRTYQGNLLVGLTTLWGCRLSGYLFLRNWGKPEDYRYRAMRERHGSSFWWKSLFYVFALQGIIMWVVSLPLQIGNLWATPGSLAIGNIAGGIICVIGILFESVGDFQLWQFKRDINNKGKVFNRGLWRYTRHPNYFGDFLVWWGLWLVSWSDIASLVTLVSPMLMSFLLIRVSGVALLEKNLSARSAEYRTYQQRTSSFFPWPPKRE